MLSAPARYVPYSSGRYEVKAGLHRLGTDFGNAALDQRVFQLDTDWHSYHHSKLQARQEQLDKYVVGSPSPAVAPVLASGIIEQLLKEYPACFRYQPTPMGMALHCVLSGDTLHFDRQLQLLHVNAKQPLFPAYRDTLDALACQCQEDACVIERTDDGRDRITTLHLCFPNHWSASDKLGSGFIQAHAPVPGMAKINRQADSLMRHLTRQGKYVRFAWGLATDRRLNHHPIPPVVRDPDDWRGRQFDPTSPALYLRIERQVLIAIPPVNALLFTIRTYFEDVAQLEQQHRKQLISAIQSMDDATLDYKGLASQRQNILEYLHSLAPTVRVEV